MANGNCVKCQGTGKTVWRHIDNGRCFDCGGTGNVEPDDRPPPKWRRSNLCDNSPEMNLRRFVSAARSQRNRGWGEEYDDYGGARDVIDQVHDNLERVSPDFAISIIREFRNVLKPRAWARLIGEAA
jgi:hypothetical protein